MRKYQMRRSLTAKCLVKSQHLKTLDRLYFNLTHLFVLICLIAFLLFSSAYSSEEKGLGLVPLTKEDLNHINQHWPKIVSVRPNKIGSKRIQEYLKKVNQLATRFHHIASYDDEIVTANQAPFDLLAKSLSLEANDPLPRHVNNSNCLSFPPIGNQGNIGSCVAWASTYYQTSHEVGLLNGYNNKQSFTNVLSPKWTYNLLNGGQDGGLMILDAYSLLSKNGAATIIDFPYDGNFLAWDMKPEDWVSAISYRTTGPNVVSGLGGSSQNLKVIKQLLNNGHVLTFGTFINSWVLTRVGKDPSMNSNPYKGQLAVSWVKGQKGGHCMTIVGYDDDIWIDINRNGKVDPGEKGAFLIANSWGPGWGNNGFIWIAYDAFLSRSSVASALIKGRVGAGEAINSLAISVLPFAPNYKPSLIAQFTLKQSVRNAIAIGAGVSDTSRFTPSDNFESGAIVYQGGRYQFDGKKNKEPSPGTFAVDLTDLLVSSKSVESLKRFYLLLTDRQSRHPTVIESFSLIDPVHQKRVSHSDTPFVCSNQQVSPYIDYNFYTAELSGKNQHEVAIASPIEEDRLQGTIEVIVKATGTVPVDRVELYVDGILNDIDTTLPYLFSMDTTTLTDGPHELKAAAFDSSENIAEAAIHIDVDNSRVSASLLMNAGGKDVK